MNQPTKMYTIPLVLSPQPEGGFTVTSTVLPEMITEGDTIQEALANVHDALEATVELYADLGKPLPEGIRPHDPGETIAFEYPVPAG